jgi:hypothetical protein
MSALLIREWHWSAFSDLPWNITHAYATGLTWAERVDPAKGLAPAGRAS